MSAWTAMVLTVLKDALLIFSKQPSEIAKIISLKITLFLSLLF